MARANWRDVAVYLLAVEDFRAAKGERAEEFSEYLRQRARAVERDIEDALRAHKLATRRAVKMLLSRDRDKWIDCELAVAGLHVGPGPKGTPLGNVCEALGGLPTVERLADYVSHPPNEDAQKVLHSLKKDGEVPLFLRRLIVGKDVKKGDDFWRIGDGYHRAPALYWDGETRVHVYANEGGPGQLE